MITYNGSVLKVGSNWLKTDVDYNPLNLPPHTIRVQFVEGVTPTFQYGTAVQVSSSPNVWDVTCENTWNNGGWANLFSNQTALVSILGANASGIQNFGAMCSGCTSLTTVANFDVSTAVLFDEVFRDCTSLTTIPANFNTSSMCHELDNLFRGCTSLTTTPTFSDTTMVHNWDYMYMDCPITTAPVYDLSCTAYDITTTGMFYGCSYLTVAPALNTANVTDMSLMFQDCTSLTAVPLYNTTRVSNVHSMFGSCVNVQTGSLDLYTQMSTQETPPAEHGLCFSNCGNNTVTGAAELAQIPQSWGGTAT